MLGISHWALMGGSYRTMLRFFHTVIPWATLFWLYFRKHLWRKNEVYLLAGDEVVVSKSIIFSLIFADLILTLALLTLRLIQSGFRYVHEILKMLPEIPEPILLTQIFAKLTYAGRIHPVSTGVEPS